MKIKTQTQLTDKLDEDLAWRKRELSSLLREIETAKMERQSALIRAGVAMLYAHWEGYIKNAATFYLNYVSLQGLRYNELAANFLGLAIKRRLDEATDTRKACVYTQVADAFGSSLQERAKLPYNIVDTQSNLSVKVFTNILCLLGFKEDPYAADEKPVIERVLNLRNTIAHGKWMSVDLLEYETLHKAIIALLDLFHTDIANAAALESFRR